MPEHVASTPAKRVVLFGTPGLAAELFETIRVLPNIEIVLVVTSPDKPAGRGQQLRPSAVKQWALEHDLPVITDKPTAELATLIAQKNIDLGIVVAYGQLFAAEFLDAVPPLINVHYSLLPRWRGASPVQSAILHGDTESGVTLFQIQPGLDDGPLVAQESLSIAHYGARQVFQKMNQLAARILHDLLSQPVLSAMREQDHTQATHCGLFTKADGELDPLTETAEQIDQKVRAFEIWPGTALSLQNYNTSSNSPSKGERNYSLKILAASLALGSQKPGTLTVLDKQLVLGCAEGSIVLEMVQMPGKKPVTGAEWGRAYLKS